MRYEESYFPNCPICDQSDGYRNVNNELTENWFFCAEHKLKKIRRIPTETSWGRALEILRIDRTRLSVSHLVRAGVTSQSAYRDLLRGPRGPTIWKLHRILRAFGLTWWDWARIYEPSNVQLERILPHGLVQRIPETHE